MEFDRKVMKVSPKTYDRVTVVKTAMEQEKKRTVTYSEALEYLLTYWETTAHLAGTQAGR